MKIVYHPQKNENLAKKAKVSLFFQKINLPPKVKNFLQKAVSYLNQLTYTIKIPNIVGVYFGKIRINKIRLHVFKHIIEKPD